MTPYEFVLAHDVPSSVQVIALADLPPTPLGPADVSGLQAAVAPGELVWSSDPSEDATGTMVTRTAEVTLGPVDVLALGQPVVALAFVDTTPPATLLLVCLVPGNPVLSPLGAEIVISGPVVAVREG